MRGISCCDLARDMRETVQSLQNCCQCLLQVSEITWKGNVMLKAMKVRKYNLS